MELYTKNLLLKTVTIEDRDEVARTWAFEGGRISDSEALNAIENMQNNHNQNQVGYIYHLCFAVLEKGYDNIIGWCGLDGQCTPGKTVIFYMIDKGYRNRGYATQCADRLLEYAFEHAGLECIHGGCFKDNIPSYRVMTKAGMIHNGLQDNGDPLFVINRETYFGKSFAKEHAPMKADIIKSNLRDL